MCYIDTMSDKLLLGFQQVKKLSDKRQEEIGQWLLDIAEQEASDVRLTPEQVDDLRQLVENPEAPVSDAEAEAVFSKIT